MSGVREYVSGLEAYVFFRLALADQMDNSSAHPAGADSPPGNAGEQQTRKPIVRGYRMHLDTFTTPRTAAPRWQCRRRHAFDDARYYCSGSLPPWPGSSRVNRWRKRKSESAFDAAPGRAGRLRRNNGNRGEDRK